MKSLFNFLFLQCVVVQNILWIHVCVVEMHNATFRSSTFVHFPEADDREPLAGILQDRNNGVSLERCGVSCLSNDQCFSFFHNPTQEICILSSIINVMSFRHTKGFSQFITNGEFHLQTINFF